MRKIALAKTGVTSRSGTGGAGKRPSPISLSMLSAVELREVNTLDAQMFENDGERAFLHGDGLVFRVIDERAAARRSGNTRGELSGYTGSRICRPMNSAWLLIHIDRPPSTRPHFGRMGVVSFRLTWRNGFTPVTFECRPVIGL